MQSDSETSSQAVQSPAAKMVGGCVSLLLLLLQSSKGSQKLADVNIALSEALQILQPKMESSRLYLNDIADSVAVLKSKLNLQVDQAMF